ncbi:acetylcholinesterase [Coccidioides immitis H538.4]|uniref:Carboxylic ester hydrolase n=3 Tax=Coccidioides immitis TaxID=5501 RepID=A0A0J8R8X9_COCIT|nr:acetylcholinesterase [Coccidioides immitis RMSCC 2394]KMU81494.1 acetylcholinesterase [Coccidioides immitis RMSCC 3703]KMU83854.1 acetylcholinesterase [Coccidioides immitis H538.4]
MHKLSPRYNEDKQEKGANSAHRRVCSTSSGTVGAWRLFRCRRRPILLLAVFACVCIYVLFLWIPSVTTGFWHWPWLREKHLEILPSWLHMALSYLLARAAPSVDISQGTVVGTVLTDSSLPRPIEAFLGVPYGQPPAGERRFKRAQPVKPSVAVIDASKYGKRCPAGPLGWTADDWGEDCLNLNLFRPKDRPHNTKLPVAVYLHGGAFNGGAGRYHSSANMISWSEEPFIIVNFNYRLGALGFLPSTITEKENALNLGLHDQILLFEWVQKNIGAFGGDPSQVTLFGLSAGAHSIGHHVMHKTRSKRLFHRAIIDSGATTARAVYPPNNPLHKRQFEEFLLEAKCSNISDDKVMPCLRSKPVLDIARASERIFNRYNPSDRWAFQPVIDGEIIDKAPIKNWKSGVWNKIPILTGFNTNEGAPFVPSNIATSEEFDDFFRALIPPLPPSDLRLLNKIYPDPLKDPESPYVEHRQINVGPQYKRITAAYGQFAYVCPVRQTAHLASEGQREPVYLYHWALNKTVKGGASHGDQGEYEVYGRSARQFSKTQETIAGFIHAYITSFITKGDPNHIKGEYADRPRWDRFRMKSARSVMVFGDGNDERAGGGHVGVAAQMGDIKWCEEECNFWSDRSILTES